ncbi:MAG TPA: hypothetical protein VIL35_09765 [Vicinamibacterales bacterium]
MSAPHTSDPPERRRAARRRAEDRGGRRREDWPADAGMTSCPHCASETLHSLGCGPSGHYLWSCPACGREFETSRASRFLL